MQYMMMLYETPADLARRTDDRHGPAHRAGWDAYIGALAQAGIVVSGNGLQPPEMATTLRMRGNERQVQDGPFADTKEQLGGYFIIEVPDLDAALQWASRAPCASTGGVEVRPVLVRQAAA